MSNTSSLAVGHATAVATPPAVGHATAVAIATAVATAVRLLVSRTVAQSACDIVWAILWSLIRMATVRDFGTMAMLMRVHSALPRMFLMSMAASNTTFSCLHVSMTLPSRA
jgi:hypothetical protein